MQQTGEYRIAAPREKVWEALNDPDVLGQCIAGCERVTRIDDQQFEVVVKAKVGPVSATFTAELRLEDLDPPNSYRIDGNVKGGAAGFAKGGAGVVLADDGDATKLSYEVKGTVGGKLAQVGSRLVDGAARKMADDFFAEFSSRLDPQATAVAAEPEAANPEPATYESSGNWKIWAVAFAVLALAIVLAI